MKIPRRWFAIIVIWLLIACVPSFRHPAVRTFQSGPWPFKLLFPAPPLEEDFTPIVEAYKNDPNIWIAAALQEPIRQPRNVIGDERDDDERDREDRKQYEMWERLSALFPRKLSQHGILNDEDQLRRVDQVIERFPNE